MTDAELLVECKKGLNIPVESIDFDGILNQKLLAVKMFLKNAGVSEEKINTELGTGTIVMGVSDLWELKSGEVKFSPVFFTFANQLSSG